MEYCGHTWHWMTSMRQVSSDSTKYLPYDVMLTDYELFCIPPNLLGFFDFWKNARPGICGLNAKAFHEMKFVIPMFQPTCRSAMCSPLAPCLREPSSATLKRRWETAADWLVLLETTPPSSPTTPTPGGPEWNYHLAPRRSSPPTTGLWLVSWQKRKNYACSLGSSSCMWGWLDSMKRVFCKLPYFPVWAPALKWPHGLGRNAESKADIMIVCLLNNESRSSAGAYQWLKSWAVGEIGSIRRLNEQLYAHSLLSVWL